MSNIVKAINLSGGYIVPKVNETYSKKPYVEIGIEGANDFFSTLIKRYQTSQTNQACIDGLTDLIYSKGIVFKDKPNFTDYFYKLTSKNDVRKIVQDYKLFGNAAIQVQFSLDRQSVQSFYHIPVNNLRAERCDEKGNIKGYYYSTEWEANKANQKAIRIPAFNSGEYESDIQILYIKRYVPGQYYYAIPDYYSGIQYCAVEEEVSNLHINNILNNFLPTTIINFNGGLPPEEEQFQIEQDIKNKFSGTTNAGRFITSFNSSAEEKTTVEAVVQPNLHDQYKFVAEEALNKIMMSHRITSQLLFGIKSATGFSSNADELKVSYDILSTMVISPTQKELLEAFESILQYNGLVTEGIMFDPLVPFTIQQDMIDSVGQAKADDIVEEGQISEEMSTNEHIKNMSGKQLQALQRIVRKYNKGELTRPQAAQLIKASFAMSDEDIALWLGEDETELATVTCSNCDWEWDEEDGYVCHKCGTDNTINK